MLESPLLKMVVLVVDRLESNFLFKFFVVLDLSVLMPFLLTLFSYYRAHRANKFSLRFFLKKIVNWFG